MSDTISKEFDKIDKEENIGSLKEKLKDNLIAVEKLELEKSKLEFEKEKLYIDEAKFDKEIEIRQKEIWQKTGLALTDILVKTGITVFGFVTLLTFEEKGTITSRLGNTVVNWIAGKR